LADPLGPSSPDPGPWETLESCEAFAYTPLVGEEEVLAKNSLTAWFDKRKINIAL
jgi:hypothetical protein